jgi:hypothetical protein
MYLIEKSAGPAIHFVAVYVDTPIGHTAKEANLLAEELTQAVIVAREHDEQADFVWEGIQRGVYRTLGTCEKCSRPSSHELLVEKNGLTIVVNEYCDEHFKALGEPCWAAKQHETADQR